MRNTFTAVSLMLATVAFPAQADLEPWKDYDISDAVWKFTTVKVDSNMGDAYLEGLRQTWQPASEAAKKLGHIEDYRIYRSELPGSGDFNLVLAVKIKGIEMMAPSQARYDAFMKAVTKEKSDKMTEKAQRDYPAMRKIAGEYLLREIKLK